MANVYVAMWEDWDVSEGCMGGDLFMSLDKCEVQKYLDEKVEKSGIPYKYTGNDFYLNRSSPYEWNKLYIDVRPLDEEL